MKMSHCLLACFCSLIIADLVSSNYIPKTSKHNLAYSSLTFLNLEPNGTIAPATFYYVEGCGMEEVFIDIFLEFEPYFISTTNDLFNRSLQIVDTITICIDLLSSISLHYGKISTREY